MYKVKFVVKQIRLEGMREEMTGGHVSLACPRGRQSIYTFAGHALRQSDSHAHGGVVWSLAMLRWLWNANPLSSTGVQTIGRGGEPVTPQHNRPSWVSSENGWQKGRKLSDKALLVCIGRSTSIQRTDTAVSPTKTSRENFLFLDKEHSWAWLLSHTQDRVMRKVWAAYQVDC